RDHESDREGARGHREVRVSSIHDLGGGVSGNAEEPGVAEGDEPGMPGEHVHAESEDGVQEDLARDVDVVGAADPEGKRGEDHESDDGGEAPHSACRPNRPCGRTTSTMSMGRNRTT